MTFFSNCRLLSKLTFKSLNLLLKVFAFIPFSKKPLIHEVYVTLWTISLILVLLLTFSNNLMNDDYSIGSLVSCVQFISQIVSNIISLGESYFTQEKQTDFFEGLARIDSIFKNNLKHTLNREKTKNIVAQQLFWVYTILMATTFVMAYTHQVTKNITILFWYSFVSTQALRLRCAQLTVFTMNINVRLRVLTKMLFRMAEKNLKNSKIKLIEFKNDAHAEREDIACFKLVFNQLYKINILINNCFGWSFLAICSSYFIDLVTNCYWIFHSKTSNGPCQAYILNGGLVLSLLLQLTVVCWHCQECSNYSKYIGCSIFKLSKPYGNKQYNDLVSEFSLQALHQTFAVSAKEFFHLNLDLLGGMIGAVVTYLVILIQFMFTERSGSKVEVPNSN